MYSDFSQLALKYLKNTEVNINNVLIMTGDFNIRDSFWDLNFPYHFFHRDTLFDIANSFQLELSKPTEFFPTKYSDNGQDSNLVLDLIFLYYNSSQHNNHDIYPDWRLTLDYIPITLDISIIEEHVQSRKWSLVKNSEGESQFIDKLISFIKSLKTDAIQSTIALEEIIHLLTNNIKRIWYKYSKKVNITKHSKAWWDNNYRRDLNTYR